MRAEQLTELPDLVLKRLGVAGLFGFVVAFVILALGFYAGTKYQRPADPVELDDDQKEKIRKERERLEREQEAFWQLTGYSADIAYGVVDFPQEGSN